MTSAADISSTVEPRTRKTNGAQSSNARDFLAGGGEMGALIRSIDWSATPIGPPEEWPHSLRTTVSLMLNSRFPMFVWWGRTLTNLYNDAYRPFLGSKHPDALGQSARDVWAEIWDLIGPRAEAVLNRGESTFDEALLLVMERYGYLEETYFTFSYSPIRDDVGTVGGIFCAVTDTTPNIIGERRLKLLRDVAAIAPEAHTPEQICAATAACIAGNSRDLPFALLYLSEGEGTCMRLVAAAGIEPNDPAAPSLVDLQEAGATWPFANVKTTGMPLVLEDIATRFERLPKGGWDRPPAKAVVAPLSEQGHSSVAGFLVAGLNPYLPYEEGYSGFIGLLVGQIAAGIANARAYEQERNRAEALAEIDRAKTLFFSNVSHEFRTPLTLMLGPLEDALADENLPAADRERLDVAQRNSLRLLKLVNSLLDFSRIEAGRAQASYEPTDLAALTADLASNFRSACERAGLNLVVDCSPLPKPSYVDKEMWEKIVLNLLSNAFKFTFEGEIAVRLRETDGHAELAVSDTGVGIPEHEMPRLFERFHRVEGQRSRTYEGSGIGLALVQELVKLNGGTIDAESRAEVGTTFRVSIPFGTAHLPRDRIGAERRRVSTFDRAEAYVQEALRWLPNAAPFEGLQGMAARGATPQLHGARVLVADDNADMRAYARQLLADACEVQTVADGEAALEAIRARRPDLVVADVMMPRLDGFGLLHAIRAAPNLCDLPVIMLSARAGEESRVDGLQAGADDYLVKPFSARELIARVSAHLALAQARRESTAALRESEAWLAGQKEAFQAAVNGSPLETSLGVLVRTVIQQLDEDVRCAFYLADPSGTGLHHVTGMSEGYAAAVDGFKIGADSLSCGLAVYTGEPVVTPDVFEEPRWKPWQRLAEEHQFRACWSFPVETIPGKVVGTFAMYFKAPREATPHDLELATVMTRAAAIIVSRHQEMEERAHAEAALRESEERYRAFVTATSDVVYRMSADWSEMHRLDGKNFIADTHEPSRAWLGKYIHLDDQAHVMEVVNEAIRRKSVFQLEHRVRRVDGTFGWTFSRAIPMLDEQGEVIEWFGTASDVTERKRAEESLKKSEADLRLRNAELARFNRAMVDRELRMIELKQEVNALRARLGENAQYPLDFEQDGRQTRG